ncbi:MAG: thiopurine S-methyltransferase [Gammaproteobacteria bacterium]|nr:thiopurine S-methyltransferase [Gammaproteobacteria bacterium]
MNKSNADFWHQRWRENNIAFHEGRVNGYLKLYFGRLQLQPGEGVFVPLCGKALDMIWIRDQGHRVLGVELSPIAVRDFFSENGIDYAMENVAPFEQYRSDGIEILCGDLYDMNGTHLQDVRGVYDRASYIAFDEVGRDAYAEFMCRNLPRGANVLLLTLEYPQSVMSGPPFSVGEKDVRRRFERRYRIELLESRDIIASQPHFQAKGLPHLIAHAFVLRDP